MSNMDNEKVYYQEKNQLYIKNNLGNEMMVPVYVKEIKNGYDSLYWSALISIDKRKSVLEKPDWDLSIGDGTPGFTVYGSDVDGIYSRFNGLDGIEPIVYPRNFHGLREDYAEIIEEFKLLNNLYYDKQKDEYISLEDGEETVIRI